MFPVTGNGTDKVHMKIVFPQIVSPVFRDIHVRDQPSGKQDPAKRIQSDDIERIQLVADLFLSCFS